MIGTVLHVYDQTGITSVNSSLHCWRELKYFLPWADRVYSDLLTHCLYTCCYLKVVECALHILHLLMNYWMLKDLGRIAILLEKVTSVIYRLK